MKTIPIIMNTDMVRALLDGRKTQDRRILKAAKDRDFGCDLLAHEIAGEVNNGDFLNSPYCKPGDLVWVRETWNACPVCEVDNGVFEAGYPYRPIPKYKPSNAWVYFEADESEEGPWRPSIHMPRWASRLTLKITDVRVERLRDISEEDAQAEGAPFELGELERLILGAKAKYRSGFCRLWQSIYGNESWTENPWVWVIEFEVIKKNIDDVLRGAA